ncbi:HSP20-like chaperone [Fomitopsis serialis]|uniref:HSP20-like chaperone n=1 Tax=Fomitopsis serialis TaxID=139415 RepID=UPI0020085ACB|nr:HSP20-like chaperone [Neoantrodia serialis]KAH9937330.1 HSP20-like chaperone [Neoantrodia serialis]
MSLSRFFNDPFFSLSDFDRRFDDAFARRANGDNQVGQQRTLQTLIPRMDVHEDEKVNQITASFELPGLKKEDVTIDVHDNVLTVSGESKVSSERDEDGYAHEDIKAKMENGVLTVAFPRSTPEQAPKKIAIA